MDTGNCIAANLHASAGLYRRLNAGLTDWLYCCFFGFAGLLTVFISDSAPPLGMALALVCTWLYFALFESSASGATPGKKRYRMRVCDVNGKRITFGKASIRFIGKVLILFFLLFPMVLAPLNRRKRAVDDFMAGTVVVNAQAEETAPVGGLPAMEGSASTTDASDPAVPAAVAASVVAQPAGSKKGSLLISIPLFIASSFIAYQLLGASWKFPDQPTSPMFPVVVASTGPDGPKFEYVQWNQLEQVLVEHPQLKLQLPVGHQFINGHSQDGETDMLSLDVSSVPGGILVELSHRDGSRAVDASYSVIDNKIFPHTMRMQDPMSLMAALLIGAVVATLLERLIRPYVFRKIA